MSLQMRTQIYSKFDESVELSAKEINDLQRGQWEIDCPQMTLESRDEKSPVTFRGAGYIKQTDNHQFIFKFFSQGAGENFYSALWGKSLLPGELIPESDYFDFRAIDQIGREWKCERLLKADTKHTATGEIIFKGNLPEIYCEGEISVKVECKGSSLNFHIFENVEIPCNEKTKKVKNIASGAQKSTHESRNVWKFSCCGFDFLMVKEEGNLLKVHTTTKSPQLPEFFSERVIETLQFVLGRPFTAEIQYFRFGNHTKCVLRSHRYTRTNPRFKPPLRPGLIDAKTHKVTTIHHRNLFEKYLKHVIDYGELSHPLWAQLNAVYEASDGMFTDAYALTLTVAIESFLRMEFSALGKPSENELKLIKAAMKHLKKWDGDTAMKERIMGSIGTFKTPRAGDRLRVLIHTKAITEEELISWTRLRNRSAHDYQNNELPTQDFKHHLKKVEVLFYHLIFHAIGYKGLYVDYSAPGWITKQYPPSV
jgi:hypothetical protein